MLSGLPLQSVQQDKARRKQCVLQEYRLFCCIECDLTGCKRCLRQLRWVIFDACLARGHCVGNSDHLRLTVQLQVWKHKAYMNLLIFCVKLQAEPEPEPTASFFLVQYLQRKLLKKAVMSSISNFILHLTSAAVVLKRQSLALLIFIKLFIIRAVKKSN